MVFLDLDPQVDSAHSPPSKRVGRTMHGNPTQPEESVLRRLKAIHIPVQFEKYILRDLLSQAPVAGHAPRQREDHGLMLVHESLEIRLPFVGHRDRFYLLIRRGRRDGMQKVRAGQEKVLGSAGIGLLG